MFPILHFCGCICDTVSDKNTSILFMCAVRNTRKLHENSVDLFLLVFRIFMQRSQDGLENHIKQKPYKQQWQ